MKRFHTCFLSSVLYLILTLSLSGQTLGPKAIDLMVQSMADSIVYYYVDQEAGTQIAGTLRQNVQQGKYRSIKDPQQLASTLTKDLRAFNGDLHLNVKYHSSEAKQENVRAETYPDHTYGFETLQFLKDNITYLKISNFSNWNTARAARKRISEIMSLLGNSEALIIDVRDNRGGVPFVASYLCSYFFSEEPVELAEFYTRFNNFSYSIFTEPYVTGRRYPTLPIYVLVNNKSASAAEELAFWLQNQGRATIIGEQTIGAGYGAMIHQLNPSFSVSISSETERDPITKKEFEQVGVAPDIRVKDELAFDRAVQEVRKRILASRNSKPTPDKSAIQDLNQLLQKNSSEDDILQQVLLCEQLGLLGIDEINDLGYQYLEKAPEKAVAILKANVLLYPFYPNPFDSYADALLAAGQADLALRYYNQAITLARLKNNPNTTQFVQNRDALQAKLEISKREEMAIRATLLDYMEGTSEGDPNRIQRAFHESLNLYSIEQNELKSLSGNTYISYFQPGQKRNRIGKIISIDFEKDAAIAKIEILMPERKRVYTDYLLLLKIKGTWKVVHKAYTWRGA